MEPTPKKHTCVQPNPSLWNLSANTSYVSPTTIQILPTSSATVPVFSLASHNATVVPTLQPFGPLSSTVISQNSTITTLKNVVRLNPGTIAGSHNRTITILNNGIPNSGIVSGSNSYAATPVTNGMQTKIVGIATRSLPALSPKTQNISVLPQNSAAPVPLYAATGRTIIVRSANGPDKFIVGPATVGTTSSTTATGPSTSGPQPQILPAKVNNAMNTVIPLRKVFKVVPLSTGTSPRQDGNSTQLNNTGATKKDDSSQIVSRLPAKIVPKSFPEPMKTREVVTPRVQPDGSVRLQKETVCWTKEGGGGYWHKSIPPSANNFTLSEVSNNPTETGVAKKFVVHLACSPPSASSKANNPSLVKDVWISPTTKRPFKLVKLCPTKKRTGPPRSSLPTKQPNAGPQSLAESSSSSDKSTFQWHHPYTGEPPSTANEAEATEDSVNGNEPVSISDNDDEPAVAMSSQPPPILAFSEIQNGPVNISHDDPAFEASSRAPLISRVSETMNDPVCISDDDNDDKRALETSSQPSPIFAGVSEKENDRSSVPDYDALLDNEELSQTNSYMHEYPACDAQEHSIRNDLAESPCLSPFAQHEPCTDVGAPSAKDMSRISEESENRTQPQKLKLKFKIKRNEWRSKFATEANSPSNNITPSKDKKSERDKSLGKAKKRKARSREQASVLALSSSEGEVSSSGSGPSIAITNTLQLCNQLDVVDSKTEITKCVLPSSLPLLPTCPGDSITSSGQSFFKWHHPCPDAYEGKSAEEPGVAKDSEFKAEPISLPHAGTAQAHVPPSLAYEPNPGDTEDIPERKCFPYSSAGELSPENEQCTPRIEPESIHSRTTTTLPPSVTNQKRFSCKTEEEFASMVYDNDLEDICSVENAPARTATPGLRCQQKHRPDITVKKMQRKLKKRSKATTEGIDTTSASKPSKRILVGGTGEEPRKFRKTHRVQNIHCSTSSSSSKNHKGHISTDLKPCAGQTNPKDSSSGKTCEPNVLRDCIVRKAIQDCYSEGLIPSVDKIHDACCESGLESPKNAIEPHLISIGYNLVKYDFERLPVEDHRLTTERIKYLHKLEKYKGRNFVYIFVSDYVKKEENGWQVSLNENYVDRSCLDSARVVLHAMSKKGLLGCGLEVLKIGLFGLKHKDIVSWLECRVMPNIPEGSVIVLGNHSVFDKNEESGDRPNLAYSKERIISWLMDHKVTSIDPSLPKAMLLSKVDNVILPRTCVFDRLVRQNGFVSMHLPKHHKDLNPIEFLWHDILDKLHKTSDVESEEGFADFVTREFSSCSKMVSSVAWDLVRKFESSYREFDIRFDEFFEKVMRANDTAVTIVADVAPKKTALPETPGLPTCPVCLRRIKLVGFRCYGCRNFWRRLGSAFRTSHYSVANLPVCHEKNHTVTRPPICRGCRRFRYELALLQQPYVIKKLPKFVLPIPPVTEEGKLLSPLVVRHKKTSKNSKSLSLHVSRLPKHKRSSSSASFS